MVHDHIGGAQRRQPCHLVLDAVRPFLLEERVLLDIRTDDQEQTHRMMRDGEVAGCVSTRDQPLQGCRIDYLGCMTYHMVAAPAFASQWFPEGTHHDGRLSRPGNYLQSQRRVASQTFPASPGRGARPYSGQLRAIIGKIRRFQ